MHGVSTDLGFIWRRISSKLDRVVTHCGRIVAIFTMLGYFGASAALPTELTAALAKFKIPQSSISLVVQAVDSDKPILSINPSKPRNPASVMKLVTTLAALEVLGPAYSWKTRYYLDGELNNEQLAGDLIIQGGGDPFLVLEQFWRHLMGLQDRGLININGNLGIDNSRFSLPNHNPGDFDRSPYRLYNVGASATLVNFNATRFLFLPGNDSVRVISEPTLPNLVIDNQLKLGDKRCRDHESGWSHKIVEKNKQVVIRFDGQYSSACGEFEWRRSVLSPEDYAYGTFKTTWEQLGGSLNGTRKNAKVGRDQKPFFVGGSKTLAEVISGTNKYSNNIMARQLLLTLGMDENATSTNPATPQAGVARIRKWLDP